MACRKCGLCEGRHHVVFGVGNPKAKILFVGEGPGENEDLQGEPFVGRAGQLLDKYLAAIDLSRESNIYIANIVKCRPPHNRDPKPEEQEACIGYLRDQLRLLSPSILVCLGRIAAMRIMDPDIRITRQHGQFVKKGNLWMMATLHPAALLRNPRQKATPSKTFSLCGEKLTNYTATSQKKTQPAPKPVVFFFYRNFCSTRKNSFRSTGFAKWAFIPQARHF